MSHSCPRARSRRNEQKFFTYGRQIRKARRAKTRFENRRRTQKTLRSREKSRKSLRKTRTKKAAPFLRHANQNRQRLFCGTQITKGAKRKKPYVRENKRAENPDKKNTMASDMCSKFTQWLNCAASFKKWLLICAVSCHNG